MKKVLTSIMVAALVGVFAIAQAGPPPMVPALKLSGYFQTNGAIASGTSAGGDPTTSAAFPYFIMSGGFSADINGTGVDIQGLTLSGLAVSTMTPTFLNADIIDCHVTLFDGVLYSAIGMFSRSTSFDSDGADAQTFNYKGSISGGYTTDAVGIGYGYGFYNKVTPVKGLSVGVYLPFLTEGEDNTTTLTVSDEFMNMQLAAVYDIAGVGKVGAGWYGNSSVIFADFRLSGDAVKGLSANVGFSYNYSTAAQTVVALNVGYDLGVANLSTEDKITLNSASTAYDFRVRGDIPVVAALTIRADIEYKGNTAGASEFILQPQLRFNTGIAPAFNELGVSFKLDSNIQTSTTTWSIPVYIEVLPL